MLIPIGHENMSARRWPVVTFALIAINIIVFLGTHQSLDEQQSEVGRLKLHLVLLAATHPELTVPTDVADVVDAVKNHYPKEWQQLQTTQRRALDDWDAKMLDTEDPEELATEMTSVSTQLEQARVASIAENYAFVPAHPSAKSYLTANFLHGSWLHLIGNLWFLWLAGFVLEDFWGRPLYLSFYLIAGAAALQFHALLNQGSMVPTLGASGAIAALMGAFLVRFPKMRIEMIWGLPVPFLRLFLRARRFKAPAYWLLPAWLVTEIFYGSVVGQSSGVAHWAHVGGFFFGAVAALGLRYSGLEHKVNRKIEADLTLDSDPQIQQANQLIDAGDLESAKTILTSHLAQKPDSVDALNLLTHVYRTRNETADHATALGSLCAVHLKAGETELAWKSYEEFLRIGGESLPSSIWLDLCRAAEKLEHFDRARAEYEKLASTRPSERQAILAQLGAARLCLKRLDQPQRALELFEAAERSPVPHLDWEQTISVGIREAKAALSQKGNSAARAAAAAGSGASLAESEGPRAR